MHNGAGAIKVLRILGALALLASVVSLTVAAGAPANVAGTWNFKVSGDAGTADQTIVIQQDGGKITGTFIISAIRIASYMDDPSDGMDLSVQFSSLPNGVSHVSGARIDGVKKQLSSRHRTPTTRSFSGQ